jgi:S1-C subfamily serine protease
MVGCLSLLAVNAVAGGALLPDEANTIKIFNKMSPFVVNVHQVSTVPMSMWQSQDVAVGVGSGFIWNNEGYIITNYHVINNSHKLAVTFYDGSSAFANLVGVDRRHDIAVLRLQNLSSLPKAVKEQTYFPISDSKYTEVGQEAIAIGSPFGLSNSLTKGTVSAVNREVVGHNLSVSRHMVQTDASINPGNSGGPLLDSYGRLIGMNTMIYSNTGGSSGVGFAVPSNVIADAARYIIMNKRSISHVGIGVVPAEDSFSASAPGVAIAAVIPGSPAAHAGLQALSTNLLGQLVDGDRILKVDSVAVNTAVELVTQLTSHAAGSIAELEVVRAGVSHTIKIRLGDIV